MNVTFACPKCDETARSEFDASTTELACPHCAHCWTTPPTDCEVAPVERCIVCPSTELFVRKDFSQKLGLCIVVVGLGASCITWGFRMVYTTFGVLFATALIDLLLYFVTGNVLTCYRCKSEYREIPDLESYDPFNLETHERHRQQQARIDQAQEAS